LDERQRGGTLQVEQRTEKVKIRLVAFVAIVETEESKGMDGSKAECIDLGEVGRDTD
jgi:hypothetical protein